MFDFDTRRLFSVDNPKSVMATDYGFLNGILYMAPAKTGGVGNLCGAETVGCEGLCLGKYSGQAAIVADLENGDNAVRRARRAKARAFMRQRPAFMALAERRIASLRDTAKRSGLRLVIRLNGSTDIRWERIRYGAERRTLLEAFPDVTFVEYTKHYDRLATAPANLFLTFSRSETNDGQALAALGAGHNVAVVFGVADDEPLPATWNGYPVIDGTLHDLRNLDPRNVVVGLRPKGAKAKADASGFVVRDYVETSLALAA